jgi:hypothetical protein
MANIIRYRRGRMGEMGTPRTGESVLSPMADGQAGINFEVDKMSAYVREFRNDPLVVKTARRLVELCDAKDKTCEMNVMYTWVKNHFRYVNDTVDEEVIQTPASHLREIQTPPDVLRQLLGDNLISQLFGFGVSESLANPKHPGKNNFVCGACFVPTGLGSTKALHHGKTSADCDEGATFLATMLEAIGIPARFRFGAFTGCGEAEPAYQHVWVQGQNENGDWLDMDVTENDKSFLWFYDQFRCYGVTDTL